MFVRAVYQEQDKSLKLKWSLFTFPKLTVIGYNSLDYWILNRTLRSYGKLIAYNQESIDN